MDDATDQTAGPRRCRKCGETKPADQLAWARGKPTTICKVCKYEYNLSWRSTPEKRASFKADLRRHNLARFGLAPADYDTLLKAQGGVCAICHKACPTGRRLAVDHDHATGRVRALLCLTCNQYLGVYERFAAQAAVYLASYGEGNPALPDGVGCGPIPRRPKKVRVPTTGNQKLTLAEVDQIRAAYEAGGITQRELATRYGVQHTTISRAIRFRRSAQAV